MSLKKVLLLVVSGAMLMGFARFGIAQEKLRVDDKTVAVVESPWTELKVDTQADLSGLCVVDSNIV